MRNLLLALGLIVGTASLAHAGGKIAPAVKQQGQQELGSQKGWLPDPVKLGFKQVQLGALKGAVAKQANKLNAMSDGLTTYKGKIGRTNVIVMDSSMEGMTTRTIVNGRGTSLE